jgi:hypothetical protein
MSDVNRDDKKGMEKINQAIKVKRELWKRLMYTVKNNNILSDIPRVFISHVGSQLHSAGEECGTNVTG